MIRRLTDRPFYDLVDWKSLLLLGLFLVILERIFLQYILNYDTLQPGDALDYWDDSLNWRMPYDSYHVPGYPFALAAMRWITRGVIQPSGVLLVTTLMAFSVTVVAVFHLAGFNHKKNQKALGSIAVSIFVLWPFVGTTYVAYPIADMFGMAPFLVGLWFLVKNQSVYGGLFLGIALISHKAMWPFVVLLLVAHLLSTRDRKSFMAVGIAVIPLGILWVLGWLHHDSASWLVSKNVAWEMNSTSNFPILDGMFGSMFFGGASGAVKGLLVLAMTIVTVAAAVGAWRLPSGHSTKWYSLGILVTVLVLVVVLNEREVWASIRFGRLIAIPLVWMYGDALLESIQRSKAVGYVAIWSMIGMIVSQFAFAYYMATIWQVSGIFPTER